MISEFRRTLNARRTVGVAAAMCLVLGLASLQGCGTSDQTYLPVRMSPVYIRVPAQQLAVSEAAKKAAATLNFSDLAGKSVYVQVNGVFPHSHYNVLDYVQSLVEGRMAQGGMLVKPTPYTSAFPAPPTAAEKSVEDEEDLDLVESVETLEVRTYEEVTDADYRAIVAVGAAGADFRQIGGSPVERFYDGKVSMVVMLIPLKAESKPLTLEATATAEHKVVGENPAYYTDDY